MPSSPSLTTGGKIVLGAGVVYLISTLLPWYSVSFKGFGQSRSDSANAWHFGLPKVAALLVIVLLAEVVVTQVARVKLPETPPGVWNLGRLGLSGLAGLLVLVELVKGQDGGLNDARDAMKGATSVLSGLSSLGGSSTDLSFDFSISRGIGMFLGVLALIALVVGNFLRLKEAPAEAGTGNQPPAPWTQQPQPQSGQFNQFNQPGQPGQFGQPDQFGQPQYGTPNQYGQPGDGQQPPYQS